jgi:hypothetical protein
MDERQDVADARAEAMLTILSEISRRLGDAAAPPPAVLTLAEAYAWLHSPDQAHGARTQPGRPGAAGPV